MTLKEKMFRLSYGEKETTQLKEDFPDIYTGEFQFYRVPDYVVEEGNGQVIYSPEMAEEEWDTLPEETKKYVIDHFTNINRDFMPLFNKSVRKGE